ncbi:hypothetical protein [Oleiphilus sp. HI0117]|nr:hypothetical protein [Oleiphilus sp. HI0117]
MSPNSIGEVLVTASFARSLVEKTGYPITLCVRPEHKAMVEALYPNRFTAVVAMDMELMRSFSTSGYIPHDHFDIDFPINLWPSQYGGGYLAKFQDLHYKRHGASGLSLGDIWRHMLQLDWDTPMERPCNRFFNERNDILTKYGVKEGEYSLFQLGNNTNKPLPSTFWSPLEELYGENQQPVLVNLKGAMLVHNNLRFNNVKQVDLDILDALYLINKSHSTVSGNNGLMFISTFLDYVDECKPELHVVMTDQYCKHYNLLNSDWEKAFVPYEKNTEISIRSSEYSSSTAQIYEWIVGVDEKADQHKKAATDVFNRNEESEFCVRLSTHSSRDAFPATVSFKNN